VLSTRDSDLCPQGTLRRGFVAEVRCEFIDWLAHGSAIVTAQPVEKVELNSPIEPTRQEIKLIRPFVRFDTSYSVETVFAGFCSAALDWARHYDDADVFDRLRKRVEDWALACNLLAGLAEENQENEDEIVKGIPGRRGYPLDALEKARQLRRNNPTWKLTQIRNQCLKDGIHEDNLPPDADSFRRWLNRKRAKRAN
jgi:hypothetical protein